MATGGRLRDSDVPDIYSCADCLEHLQDRNPRFLSCYHSFCQQCLQKLTKDRQLSCPSCRAITAVPNNDVTKLTMNFQLVQIMEREKELKEQKQTHFSGQNCQFWGKENAICKCGDCNQFLCEGCETKHKKMNMFRNHVILKLCQKHYDGISHICMKCVQAVCVKCIVLDHADHEDKVTEYQGGIGQLKSSLEETKRKLRERRNVIEQRQNEADSKTTDVNKEQMKLERRRNALVKEIEQIDHDLLDLNEKERKCDEDVKIYKELKDKFDVSCRSVDELLQSSLDQIISSFSKQNMLAEKILNETEKMNIQFKMDLNEELKWLKKPILENTFDILGNFQMKFLSSIKLLQPDLFVYSDLDTNRFVVFDNKGAVIRSFEGQKEHGKVTCVDVYKNRLYLAQEKHITCLYNFNTSKERIFASTPKIRKMCRMAVATDNVLICTDYDESKVYEYNTEDDTTKMLLKGLNNPSYISVDHTPQGTRYILTLKTPGVNIYNQFWQLLTTIKQDIHEPWDTAPCPGGFLLVGHGSNKITLYSYTGDLVRTVLTKQDGLYGPTCLTLKPPFLWVGQSIGIGSNGRIQSFRVL